MSTEDVMVCVGIVSYVFMVVFIVKLGKQGE